MNDNRIMLLVVFLIAFVSAPLFGQITGSNGSGENIQIVIDMLTVLFLLVGVYIALDLNKIMKGGELASSWGWLSGAVIIFALIKVIEVGAMAGFWPVSQLLISISHFAVGLFLMFGFFKQRKILG